MLLISGYRPRAMKSLLIILLLLRNPCFSQQFEPASPNNIAIHGAVITLYGYAARGPHLGRHTCRSMLDCSHLCLKNAKCFSFNYQLSSVRSGSCELSRQSISSKEERDTLTEMPGFVFVQIVGNDMKPKTCFDHLQAGGRHSGFYEIFDNDGSLFPVYCDLTSESSAAWTLFMSYKTSGTTSHFKTVPLFKDKPVNGANPNWSAYRLSLSRMKHLRSRSTHWRVTCTYQLDGLVYRDYVRTKISDFDPIDFKLLGNCERVEYINVRGHSCSDCNTSWWQKDTEMLHFDSSRARCGFDPSNGSVFTEDNFGFYGEINPSFRCSDSTRESTTNHWFGSYLHHIPAEWRQRSLT